MMKREEIKKHALGNNIVVFTNEVHRFGTDGVLLSAFAAPKLRDKTIEFGTGCGIISLLWCRHAAPLRIDAVELQPEAVALVQKAIEENQLQNRLQIIEGDLRRIEQYTQKGYYDLAVMNPPYKKVGDGVISPVQGLAIARHELSCTLSDICKAAATVLNTGGRFCMCHRPGRLSEVVYNLHSIGLEPKRLRFVQQRAETAPNLFLIESKKGASSGMIVEPPLILEQKDGTPTGELIELYGTYYEQKGRTL